MSNATDTKVKSEDTNTSDVNNNLTDLTPRDNADITGGCIFPHPQIEKIV